MKIVVKIASKINAMHFDWLTNNRPAQQNQK